MKLKSLLLAAVVGVAPLNGNELELLFEGELETYEDVRRCVVVDAPSGAGFEMTRDLVAQGEGVFRGKRLSGTLTFSQLGKRAPDDAFCSTLIAGFLETATGEEIFFEGRGFALSNQNEDVWSYTASLRFDEPDTPYEWLRHTPAVWVGTLDAKRRRARYRVYFPTRAPKSGN